MIRLTSNCATVRSKSPLLTLSIAEGDCSIRCHEIKELPAIIGRGTGSEVVLHDPTVSHRHCVLTYSGGRLVLQDLDSSHGTIVNGRRIRECPLEHGDSIRLGKTASLRVVKVADASHFHQATWNISVREPAEAAVTNSRRQSTLRVKFGIRALLHPSRVVAIESFPCLIGRQEGADLCVEDRFASSSHCLLNQILDNLVIQDLESRNGTRLNGESIHCATLEVGDTVEIGTTRLTVLSVERKEQADLSSHQTG